MVMPADVAVPVSFADSRGGGEGGPGSSEAVVVSLWRAVGGSGKLGAFPAKEGSGD